MGFFTRSRHIAPTDSDNELDSKLSQLLQGPSPERRLNVTEKGSLGLSAVWACVRILSNSAGILPLHLYKRNKDGRTKVSSHPVVSLLREPNDYWTRFDLVQWLMTSTLLWGNGYVRIVRDKATYRPVRLMYLQPYDVTPELDDNGMLHYMIASTGEMLDSSDVIHIKGLGTDPIKGLSPIQVHRENLALSKEAQGYGERFFSEGGNTSSVFTIPGELKETQFKRLKADIDSRVMGIENAHKPMLLEGGMKYERINIPLNDAQFIETRKFQGSEIAAIFGVPPHMLGNLDRATYNNTELLGIEYVTYSLMPWLQRLQLEFDRKLLYENEKDKFYLSFQVNGLMRGDAKSRSEYYKNMTLIGAMNANEVRELEDMNSYPAGDKFFVQMNMTSADMAAKPDKNE